MSWQRELMRLPHRHVLSGRYCDGTDARSTPEPTDAPRHPPSTFLPVQQVGAASRLVMERLRWEMLRDARVAHARVVCAPPTQAAVPAGQIIWALNSLAGFRAGAGCGCGSCGTTGSHTPFRVAKSDLMCRPHHHRTGKDARCLGFRIPTPHMRRAIIRGPMGMGRATFGGHSFLHPRLVVALTDCCCELDATG